MDIFLDDIHSLQLLRTVRRGNCELALIPTQVKQVCSLAVDNCKLDRLGIPALLGYLRIPEKGPLGILVPDGKSRVRTRGITCKIRSRLHGDAPLRQLVSTSNNPLNNLLTGTTRVFVLSPANIALEMAKRLLALEHRSNMPHQKTVLMMVKLCLELCGTYSHNPFDPIDGDVVYNVTPALDVATLRAFVGEEGRERGLSLLREASELAYDLSGSPQESFLGPALFFSDDLGGLKIAEFEANQPLKLKPAERRAIGWRRITPDFTMAAYRSVVEYLGAVHLEDDNPQIDHVRSLDYQTLGIREFGFWYDDVKSVDDFMNSARRIVSVIETFDGPRVRQRFERLARSKVFAAKQKTLFEVYRPWLRGEKDA